MRIAEGRGRSAATSARNLCAGVWGVSARFGEPWETYSVGMRAMEGASCNSNVWMHMEQGAAVAGRAGRSIVGDIVPAWEVGNVEGRLGGAICADASAA